MKKWYYVALFNLVVLAFLGLVLRYKINFPLPVFQQENLLHAHSHFAFNGWISFVLQLLILEEFTDDYRASTKFWNRFLILSTIINYAMIVSFAWVGYAGISIVLSTVALWLSYAFAYKIYKTIPVESKTRISTKFMKASLFFLLLSSIGPYALAIVIATKSSHQYWYHNALYFFLHFQYNGWFTFAILAFLFRKLEQSTTFNIKHANWFFSVLFYTCIPSYFLTALWHQRPFAVTALNVVTAVSQAFALVFLVQLLYSNMKSVFNNLPAICRWLYSLSILAFIIKILLQFFSAHPVLGQLAFGFRPIIIGYLHLIFLAFVTMYILGFLADKAVINLKHSISSIGLIVFATGIILNEILLAVQGLTAIYYLYLPSINLLLFANTFTLLGGAILLFVAAKKDNARTTYSSHIHDYTSIQA
jgi:hypothetical protein